MDPMILNLPRAIFAFLFIAFFCLIAELNSAQAQTMQTRQITLSEGQQSSAIGPYAYITRDEHSTLSYAKLMERHRNNLRGARNPNVTMHFGLNTDPHWMIVHVQNNTRQTNWLLDFGSSMTGNWALLDKLSVRNDTIGRTFAFVTDDRDNAKSPPGSVIPIALQPNAQNVLVIYFQSHGSRAQTMSPHIISENAYLENAAWRASMPIALTILLFLSAGFYLSAAYLKEQPDYAVFAVYYIAFGLSAIALNNNFVIGSFLDTLWHPISIMLIGLSSLVITKIFFRLSENDRKENMLIVTAGGFAIIMSIVSIVLFAHYPQWALLSIYIPLFLCLVICVIIAFAQGQIGTVGGHFFAAGWGGMLFGVMVTASSAMNILPPNGFTMNAYLIALVPQAYFFIESTRQKLAWEDEQERHDRARAERKEMTLARLKQSKESADQARLLRVLDKERELMTELREREAERSEEMRKAKEAADEANRAKSAFLAVVSHEIRTPMTGIMGMVRFLMETSLTKDQTQYASAIQNSGNTMMALLNDILDFEKIERGGMELEYINFDVKKVVESVTTLMSGHAANKGLTLKADIPHDMPPYFIGDPTRLRQVLLNLVNNAIKFTDSGQVTIEMKCKELTFEEREKYKVQGDHEIYIGVKDTGIGISEEAQAKLFSPFAQADSSTSRKYGGTGLGLAICKRIIESMGSAVQIKSRPGEGSLFFFHLLLEQADSDHNAEDSRKAAIPRTPQKNILIVEDNKMNRQVLKRFLEQDGHIVTSAENAQEAMKHFEKPGFDLIFTDINLSDEKSGFDLINEIRALDDETRKNIPVFALTGNTSKDDIQKFHDHKFHGHLPKPIDPSDLSLLIHNAHEGRFSNQALSLTKAPPQDPSDKDLAKEIETKPNQAGSNIPLIADMKRPAEDTDEFGRTTITDDQPQTSQKSSSVAKVETNGNDMSTLDLKAIQALHDSLGKDSLVELMQGCIDQADQIIANLKAEIESGNLDAIAQRSHELKGMAANFGMKALSDVSDAIEVGSKDGKNEEVTRLASDLDTINEKTKSDFQKWLQSH